MTYVRYDELLQAVKARQDTMRMRKMLGGMGRVYLEGEDYSNPEDTDDIAWGRLVIVPTINAWPELTSPVIFHRLGLLFRAEVNNFHRVGFSATRSLEAIHDEVYNLMQQWTAPGPFIFIRQAQPFFMAHPPQPRARYEETRNVFWTSTVFRTSVARPDIEPGAI